MMQDHAAHFPGQVSFLTRVVGLGCQAMVPNRTTKYKIPEYDQDSAFVDESTPHGVAARCIRPDRRAALILATNLAVRLPAPYNSRRCLIR